MGRAHRLRIIVRLTLLHTAQPSCIEHVFAPLPRFFVQIVSLVGHLNRPISCLMCVYLRGVEYFVPESLAYRPDGRHVVFWKFFELLFCCLGRFFYYLPCRCVFKFNHTSRSIHPINLVTSVVSPVYLPSFLPHIRYLYFLIDLPAYEA